MNITFLIGNLSNSGGTQRMLTLLCNELIDNFEITILVHKDGESFFPLDKKIQIEVLKGNLIQKNIQIYKSLKKNKSNYYVNLDSNSVLFNGFFLPSFTKLIVWEHFSIVNNYNKWHFKLSRKYAVKRAYKFVLLSDFEVLKWNEIYKLPINKCVRIYNPVTVELENDKEISKYQNKTFLSIGNKIDVKGFDLLLNAWKQINSDWILNIVGLSTNDINALKQKIEEKQIQNVLVFPKTNDIKEFYKKASVFVLSSRKEATPLVLLESQSFGLPAIVFNHLPSVMELLDNSALIADFNTPVDSLKEKIEQIIGDEELYNELSDNAYKNATKFSIDSFKNNWLKLLK